MEEDPVQISSQLPETGSRVISGDPRAIAAATGESRVSTRLPSETSSPCQATAIPPVDDAEIPLAEMFSSQSVSVPKSTKTHASGDGGSAVIFPRPHTISVSNSALPSESSVCRLCLLNQEEANEALVRLHCQCKGSIRFVHKSCARRWTNIRGGRAECENCGQPMLAETRIGRCFRRVTLRWRNASYKETVVAFSLVAFIFWLFSYCIYLFTKGILEVVNFHKVRSERRNYDPPLLINDGIKLSMDSDLKDD